MLANIFSGDISGRLQLIALGASIIVLWGVIHLIRQEKLKEGYSIIWFFIGTAMVIFSAAAGLLDVFAKLLGIAYTPAALFVIMLGGLILLSLHFSVIVSKHEQHIRLLAQENALLQYRLQKLEKQEQRASQVSAVITRRPTVQATPVEAVRVAQSR